MKLKVGRRVRLGLTQMGLLSRLSRIRRLVTGAKPAKFSAWGQIGSGIRYQRLDAYLAFSLIDEAATRPR